MRLGVIDIGSNTVHLLVVDAYPGAHPLPSSSHKIALRLSEGMTADGSVSGKQADRLIDFVRECVKLSDDQGVERSSPSRRPQHVRRPMDKLFSTAWRRRPASSSRFSPAATRPG